MKKIIVILLMIGIFLLLLIYSDFRNANAKLVEDITVSKEMDDFILHIRIENTQEGIEVFRSLQYVGNEEVVVHHQSPLISVSIDHKNHDFTGSPVNRTLKSGNVYIPQDPDIFPIPRSEKMTNIYFEARFKVNGEWIVIDHVEELHFN